VYGFSWKRALGISRARYRLARATGIPTTKRGRKQKLDRLVARGVSGAGLLAIAAIISALSSQHSINRTALTSSPPILPEKGLGLPIHKPSPGDRPQEPALVPQRPQFFTENQPLVPETADPIIENDPGVRRARLELQRYQEAGNQSNIRAAQRTLERAIVHARAMANGNPSGSTLVRPKRTLNSGTPSDPGDD